MIFGVTVPICSVFLRFARRIAIRLPQTDNDAQVRMPDPLSVQELKDACARLHQSLSDVYSVAGSLKLRLQQVGSCTIQNQFYNGWTHDHYVSNVLVFFPNARIIACTINCSGSMNDSSVSTVGDICNKLEAMFDSTGDKCVVDSAFCRARHPFLIKSSTDPVLNASSVEELRLYREATAARQAAEWRMRAFQAAFPRSKDRLEFETRGERRLIL